MTTVTMIAPSGSSGQVSGPGANYQIGSDGTVSVPSAMVTTLIGAGFKFFRTSLMMATILAPFIADLVSIKAAATPIDGVVTIVKQPDVARKLAIRVVIGTSPTTAITAGALTLVGVDQDGNALTEVISLVTDVSVTIKTTYAFSKLTSGTVAGYVASGGGTGNTLGIGVAADLGIMTGAGQVGLALIKATKVVHTYTGAPTTVTNVAVIAADDVAATAVVDQVARTIAPTTAPGATATTSTDYQFAYSFGLAD